MNFSIFFSPFFPTFNKYWMKFQQLFYEISTFIWWKILSTDVHWHFKKLFLNFQSILFEFSKSTQISTKVSIEFNWTFRSYVLAWKMSHINQLYTKKTSGQLVKNCILAKNKLDNINHDFPTEYHSNIWPNCSNFPEEG